MSAKGITCDPHAGIHDCRDSGRTGSQRARRTGPSVRPLHYRRISPTNLHRVGGAHCPDQNGLAMNATTEYCRVVKTTELSILH
ncbi:hypothetical protein I552_3698 [Mycobacterium xenopi 3993]|nr:hypothetical protein I552_3698 [Mycobacterium xenopi 3993]